MIQPAGWHRWTPLEWFMREHLESLKVRGYSEFTVKNRQVHIGFFIQWSG